MILKRSYRSSDIIRYNIQQYLPNSCSSVINYELYLLFSTTVLTFNNNNNNNHNHNHNNNMNSIMLAQLMKDLQGEKKMIGLFDQIVPYFLLQQHSGVQPLLDEQN